MCVLELSVHHLTQEGRAYLAFCFWVQLRLGLLSDFAATFHRLRRHDHLVGVELDGAA